MSKEIYWEIKLVACCRRLALWVWPDSPFSGGQMCNALLFSVQRSAACIRHIDRYKLRMQCGVLLIPIFSS